MKTKKKKSALVEESKGIFNIFRGQTGPTF